MTGGAWPNLIVAGTQKAGTTWLQRALARHPDIVMSDPKELYFFGRKGWRDPGRRRWYRSHFPNDDAVRYRGEATSNYFWRRSSSSPWSPPPDPENDAASGIRATLGTEVTVLVMLRNPVERAVAGANHHLTMGRIAPDDDILAADPALGIVDLGFYGRHLEHWLSVLDPRQMEVVLFDDLATDPLGVFDAVLASLDVPADRVDELAREEIDRPTHTRHEIRAHRNRTGIGDVVVTEALVDHLLAVYAEDVARTEAMLGRTLAAWRDRDRLIEALVNTPGR